MNPKFDETILELKSVLCHQPDLLEKVESYINKLENESKSYRDQLLDTRHKLIQTDYTVQNQKKVIDNTGKALERFVKENKAMRELIALWV